MADALHTTLSKFRDSILTAVARLEFELRDTQPKEDKMDIVVNTITNLTKVISSLECKMSSESSDILQIEPSQNTRNVVVSSTPALSAAVAAISPPEFEGDVEEDDVIDVDSDEEGDVVTEEDEEEEDDDSEEGIEVEEFMYKGITYQRDGNGTVYLDGDEVGTWNGKKILPLV